MTAAAARQMLLSNDNDAASAGPKVLQGHSAPITLRSSTSRNCTTFEEVGDDPRSGASHHPEHGARPGQQQSTGGANHRAPACPAPNNAGPSSGPHVSFQQQKMNSTSTAPLPLPGHSTFISAIDHAASAPEQEQPRRILSLDMESSMFNTVDINVVAVDGPATGTQQPETPFGGGQRAFTSNPSIGRHSQLQVR